MILTGKCKEKFLEWYNEPETYFYGLNKTCQNALIIEFFDSVGVYIYLETGTYFNKPNFRYKIITNDDTCIGYKEYSRQESTIQAIKKANDIYNVRYSKQKQVK